MLVRFSTFLKIEKSILKLRIRIIRYGTGTTYALSTMSRTPLSEDSCAGSFSRAKLSASHLLSVIFARTTVLVLVYRYLGTLFLLTCLLDV